MYIKRLALTNFRNFTDVDEVTFPENGFLIAAAPNATGKTNFLEAMMVLLRGRSFRGSCEECVRWGADSFILRGEVAAQSGEARIAVRYHQPTRKLRIEQNGVPASPVTFLTQYPVVLFLPDDTQLVTGGPTQRRNFLNQVLVTIPAYLSALVQYHRALKQRNVLLKNAANFSDVAAWTEILVEYSEAVWKQRESFVQFLDTQLPEIYQSTTGEELSLELRLMTATMPDDYREKLRESFSHERRYGYTLHGPHRDELAITAFGRPASASLSRGQQRNLVIALKLAAFRFITKTTNEQPLLLLDEILSELDNARQEQLLQALPSAQILLTTTSVPAILKGRSNVHLLDIRSILLEESEKPPVPTVPIVTPVEEEADVEVPVATAV